MNQEIQNKPAVQQEFYDAFISYGRKESKHFATKLNQQLSDKGYNIWIDHESSPQHLKNIGADIERIVLARAVKSHLENRIIVTGNRTVVFPETSA